MASRRAIQGEVLVISKRVGLVVATPSDPDIPCACLKSGDLTSFTDLSEKFCRKYNITNPATATFLESPVNTDNRDQLDSFVFSNGATVALKKIPLGTHLEVRDLAKPDHRVGTGVGAEEHELVGAVPSAFRNFRDSPTTGMVAGMVAVLAMAVFRS